MSVDQVPPTLTLFTPTYNRARTLDRLFESLVRQSRSDFEWLVIDDGSSDDTAAVVEGCRRRAPFPVRYFCQPNGGKHVAHNAALPLAEGELFAVLDSDDWLVERAVERMITLWSEVPVQRQERLSGMTFLVQYPDGRIVGERFPGDGIECSPLEMVERGGYVGEKWGFHRTVVLRQYPFPAYPGSRLVPEGLIWNRIGRRFLIRFVNEVLRVADFRPDGLSARRTLFARQAPRPFYDYHLELAGMTRSPALKLKAMTSAVRYGMRAGAPWLRDLGAVKAASALALAVPCGAGLAAADAFEEALARWRG